jgi:uncharacterized protein YbjT (DUF2867 family)
MSKTILVTGATGNVSSGIIAKLKGSGHRLRALVRHPEKAAALERQGVEVHAGDLEKPWTQPAFASAIRFGSDAAGPAPEQSSNALWAASRRRQARGACRPSVPRITPPSTAGHALSDARLAALALPSSSNRISR